MVVVLLQLLGYTATGTETDGGGGLLLGIKAVARRVAS